MCDCVPATQDLLQEKLEEQRDRQMQIENIFGEDIFDFLRDRMVEGGEEEEEEEEEVKEERAVAGRGKTRGGSTEFGEGLLKRFKGMKRFPPPVIAAAGFTKARALLIWQLCTRRLRATPVRKVRTTSPAKQSSSGPRTHTCGGKLNPLCATGCS